MTAQETNTKSLPWHALELAEISKRLKTDPQRGLMQKQVAERRQAWGKNLLPRGKRVTAVAMFLRQFKSPLVYILLIAALLTWWLKEYVDMAVILLVVAVNAAIGLFQEYRANQIFEKLKAIVRVEALIVREGRISGLDSEELVPGDVVILRAGSKVPADARLTAANNLTVNEALLTGESKPVKKLLGTSPPEAMIGDRANMLFMGTGIEGGEGQAIVVATGAGTEIGQISTLTQNTAEEETPLQKRMGKLGRFLSELFLAISGVIFLLGLFREYGAVEMLKTTVAVAVAAIPEGLPAAISVILAVSSQKILHRRGLVMRLVAAETLGSTSVICADKTGTLTYGQMRVEEILAADEKNAMLCLALANEAVLEEKDNRLTAKGETTDKAKLEKFLAAGGDLKQTLKSLPRLGFLPFDDRRRYIASLHRDGKNLRIFLTGAPETILKLSSLPAARAEDVKRQYENYARRGFRMIAMAGKTLPAPAKTRWSAEELSPLVADLDYLGLAAIRDPVREDVKRTLQITRQAGIKVLMVTGDHILTAKAVGLELGFATGGDAVITGEELDALDEKTLLKRIGRLEIIARVNPVHKMRVIDAWQKLGAVVAMTGDGVNDAPALKAADIGVALGSGTDVSKEASDLVLLNDSFNTITAAVAEGRTGFANIRKATLVVMSNAFTELTLITGALMLGLPFPITAVQILWVNLVTDSLPVLSLAFEPNEPDVMAQKPIPPKEPILNRELKVLIFAVGICADLLLVGIFLWLLKFSGWELVKIQSFIFLATAAPTLINIFAFKSLKRPLLKIALFNNHFLVWSVVLGFAFMFAAIYLPVLSGFLKTAPLSGMALLAILMFVGLKLVLVELTKWWFWRTKT